MAYQHIRIPESGEKITVKDGKLQAKAWLARELFMLLAE